MKKYYVNKNKQSNGDHEVHEDGCNFLKMAKEKEFLGDHSSCSGAVSTAKTKGYNTANGCYYCSNACHTS